ncbi:MAG: hypothetical protein OYH77_03460 [Pseudomonadota bacterium]|nr:hypothetical protein [Pseudomonadota bacterium]
MAVIVCAAVFASCGNRMSTMTSAPKDERQKPKPDDSNQTPESPSSGTPIAAPKNWPKCWLSTRLAAAEALKLLGFHADDVPRSDPLYKGKESSYGYSAASAYRYDFKGGIKNPDATGKCVLNWMVAGHSHSKEPWVHNHPPHSGAQDYFGIVSCTADKTPECTCLSGFRSSQDDPTGKVSMGLCVGNGNSLVRSNDFAGANQVQLTGADLEECRNINKSAFYHEQQFGNDDYQSAADNSSRVINKYGLDVSCRLDVEPLTPIAAEKDWYAHAITHWGAVSCHKKGVDTSKAHCRCYILKQKSIFKSNQRSRMYSFDNCMRCDSNDCKFVSNL